LVRLIGWKLARAVCFEVSMFSFLNEPNKKPCFFAKLFKNNVGFKNNSILLYWN
jgi:hypothetical protein